MTTTFPHRKFVSTRGGGIKIEGELVLESSTAWQVAVDGKVQLLQKTEWMDITSKPNGGFEDIFSMFNQRPANGFGGNPFGGLFGG